MRHRVLITATTLLLTATACGSDDATDGESAPAPSDVVPVERSAELSDPEGSVLGTAWLRDADDGTEVELDVSGLPEGLQDVGLYESQDCSSVTPDAPVVQLPSLPVDEDGTGALTTAVDVGSLGEILAGDGVTVVVTDARVDAEADAESELPDDYLACGTFSG